MSDHKTNSKSKDKQHAEFLAKAREQLDKSVDSLDEVTRNRLATARRNALDQAGKTSPSPAWWLTVPGAAAAVFVVSITLQKPALDSPSAELLQDLELLILQEELELFETAYLDAVNGQDENGNPLLEPHSES